jgi:hypothetical protein
MATESQSARKQTLNQVSLEEHHIYYNDDPQDVLRRRHGRDFPPQFLRLQQALLDFDCTIHERFSFEEEHVGTLDWDREFRDCHCGPEEIEAVERDVRRYGEMRAQAYACENDGVLEHKWEDFYLERFLKRLFRESNPLNSDTRWYVSLQSMS